MAFPRMLLPLHTQTTPSSSQVLAQPPHLLAFPCPLRTVKCPRVFPWCQILPAFSMQSLSDRKKYHLIRVSRVSHIAQARRFPVKCAGGPGGRCPCRGVARLEGGR